MYSTNYIGKWIGKFPQVGMHHVLISIAVGEIVSMAVAVVAMWIAIDRGMGEPLTRNLGKSVLKRLEPIVNYFKPRVTGTTKGTSTQQAVAKKDKGRPPYQADASQNPSTKVKTQSEKASGTGVSQSNIKEIKGARKRDGLFRRLMRRKSDKVNSDLEAGDE
jgi:hypothetical protein